MSSLQRGSRSAPPRAPRSQVPAPAEAASADSRRGPRATAGELLASRRRGRRRDAVLVAVLRALLLVVITGGWELAARMEWVDPVFTSRPTQIFHAFLTTLSGDLIPALRVTLFETLVGFAMASLVGFLLGCALYQFRVFDRVVQPFLTAFNSLPRIALAPLFVLWFGLGAASRIALVFSLVVFIVISNTYAGLHQGDRDYLMLGRQLGARGLTKFRFFVLPAAVPTLFAGLQLGLVYAFLGAVAGEMLSGSGGVGASLSTALASFHTDVFMANLVALVVVTVAFGALMKLVERRLLRWQRHELRGVGGGV